MEAPLGKTWEWGAWPLQGFAPRGVNRAISREAGLGSQTPLHGPRVSQLESGIPASWLSVCTIPARSRPGEVTVITGRFRWGEAQPSALQNILQRRPPTVGGMGGACLQPVLKGVRRTSCLASHL